MHRAILSILYLVTLIAVLSLILWAGDYYLTPLGDRPHHPQYDLLKPSGLVSHGLGVVGSMLMVLLLLYIARKHLRFMQEWGNIRRWLDYHIWLGISGPILVTFHTTFKFGGIVAISYWSMMAVALSGFFGRYIYLQIPRRINGQEMSVRELHELESSMLEQVRDRLGDDLEKFGFENLLQNGESQKKGFRSLFTWLSHNLRVRRSLRQLRAVLREKEFTAKDIRELTSLVKQQRVLRRRITFLHTARAILHYWHVIHRPFAVVMFVILAIHIAVEILLGYSWIF